MSKGLIALADHAPHFKECETAEPTLREIVFSYYAPHFTKKQAKKLTDQYFDALSSATPAGGGSKDERRAFEPEQLAQAIRVRASIAGIGLNELERRAGWKPGDMYGVLKTNMTMKSLQRFADALGIPAWMLLRDSATNAAVAAISREQS